VKPPPFDYLRVDSVEQALDALTGDADAKIIAGGQSLIPMLNLRLARPSLLIDISRLPGLDDLTAERGGIRLGALVRHSRLLASSELAQHAPLLVQAARHIGHVAIRNQGTCGGSVAHADPAAELPLALVALEASFRLKSTSEERTVLASEFFQGAYTTALRDDEMLVEIIVPPRASTERAAFLELTVREGDFAIVAVAVVAQVLAGRLSGVRVVWSGADFVPVVAQTARLEGESATGDAIERVIAESVALLTPPSDIRASGEYRREALRVLTTRALRSVAPTGGTHDT
jgi:aerobic carbon-monoxide dehydrogenase medium subunit